MHFGRFLLAPTVLVASAALPIVEATKKNEQVTARMPVRCKSVILRLAAFPRRGRTVINPWHGNPAQAGVKVPLPYRMG